MSITSSQIVGPCLCIEYCVLTYYTWQYVLGNLQMQDLILFSNDIFGVKSPVLLWLCIHKCYVYISTCMHVYIPMQGTTYARWENIPMQGTIYARWSFSLVFYHACISTHTYMSAGSMLAGDFLIPKVLWRS